MRTAAILVLLGAVSCSGGPPPAPAAGSGGAADGADGDTTDGTDTADGADATDSTDGTDGADSTDGTDGSPDTGDTGGVPPCTLGLSVATGADDLPDASTLDLGTTAAWADRIRVTLTLHNPCEDDLRFLGHPGDWTAGTGFALDTLPPVYLEPGASAPLDLLFEPAETGEYSGTFSLPYDQLGSPFDLDLTATVGPPLTVVFVGDGRRVTTTTDYGATFALDQWDTLDGHTNALQRGACAGGGQFVSVGGSDQSSWWSSSDGIAWTSHESDATSWMADCAFSDGDFFATNPYLSRSSDGGVTWTVGSTDTYSTLGHARTLAAGDGVVVAAGDSGRIAVSTDGITWDSDATPLTEAVNEIAYMDGVFVVAGDSGLLAASTDGGQTWTERRVGTRDWTGLVASRDGFFAGDASNLYQSSDGVTWSLVNATPVVPLAAVGPLLFGATGAALFRSDDGGFTWTELRPDDGGPSYLDASVGG